MCVEEERGGIFGRGAGGETTGWWALIGSVLLTLVGGSGPVKRERV